MGYLSSVTDCCQERSPPETELASCAQELVVEGVEGLKWHLNLGQGTRKLVSAGTAP